MVLGQPVFHQILNCQRTLKTVVPNILLFSFLFASNLPVSAQINHCATGSPSIRQLNKITEAAVTVSQQRTMATIKHIAIKPLVVRNTNGTGGASIEDMNQTLASLNNTFKDLNVEFYFCSTGIKYIDNSDFFDFDNRQEDDLTRGNDVHHSINIYFLNSIKINGFEGSGGYAYYPGSESYTNRIFIVNDATKGGHTLAHELGHYFGLVHTFERIGGMELVSRGSEGNCADAGDHICDTDADPYGMDAATWEGCEYNGTVTDMNGDLYTPPADNIMSYYNHCSQRFTPGQFERMELGAFVRVSQTEYSLLAGTPANVAAPANLTYTLSGANIVLKWADMSGNETGFLLERSTSLTEGYEIIAGLVPNTTSFKDVNVMPGVAYYYRVKPSNTTVSYSNVVLHCPVIADLASIEGMNEACSGGYEYSVPLIEGLTYDWSVSGGGTISENGNKVFVEWATPGLHFVSVTASNACSIGPTQSMYVEVNRGTFAEASSIIGIQEVCVGTYSYAVQPKEGISYKWTLSSGGSISGQGSSVNINWDIPGNHTIAMVPLNSCGEGEAINLKVKVLENPSSEDIGPIQTRNTTVCLGSHKYSVAYFNNVQYEWSIPEGSGTVQTDGATATVNWEVPGVYTVSVNPVNNCANDLMQTLQIRVIEAPEKPSISVISGKLNSNYQGEHQWFLDGEPISGAIGPVCPATLAGTYTVQQITACGLGTISDAHVLDKPLESNDEAHQIFIFPNPASSNVYVELSAELQWKTATIVSAMGEQVMVMQENDTQEITIRGNLYKQLINFNVDHLAPGLYMVKFQMEAGTISKRLLVK
ncbi:MAG: M43 family zinc metalloprotease [Bacteroidota bacterium]|nr:M43 family zinc metalloprotease [Bacteroidota bacterium]